MKLKAVFCALLTLAIGYLVACDNPGSLGNYDDDPEGSSQDQDDSGSVAKSKEILDLFDPIRFSDELVGPALFPPRQTSDTVVFHYGEPQPPGDSEEKDEYLRSLDGIHLLRDSKGTVEILSYEIREGSENRFWWTNVVALDAGEPAFVSDRLRIGAFDLKRIEPARPDTRFAFYAVTDAADRADIVSVVEAADSLNPELASVPVFLDARSLMRIQLTGEILVQTFGSEYREVVEKWADVWDGSLTREMRRPGRFLVRVPAAGSAFFMDALSEIRVQDWAQWAEPDLIQSLRLQYVPNDPHYHYQWHLNNTGQVSPGAELGGTPDADVDAPEAWDSETGGAGVTIAIIDTGVQCDHPDFAGRCDAGYDFFDDDTDPSPSSSIDNHGQACAGIAAAHGNNAQGVAGICYDCRILPIKVAEGSSWGSNATLADAIEFAADNAEVISCSWMSLDSIAIHDATIYATTQGRAGKGVPVFFASGNYRLNTGAGHTAFWAGRIEALPAGTHTIRFEFRYDPNGAGLNAAFIDSVLVRNGDGSVVSYNGFTNDGVPVGWTECAVSDAPWSGSGAPYNYYAGVDIGSIRSGALTYGDEMSCVQFTVSTTVANGDLYFRYFRNSHPNQHLVVVVDSGSGPDEFSMPHSQMNMGWNFTLYPAQYAETIAVGASTDTDLRSPYSQYGPELDIVAPSLGGWAGTTTTDRTGADGYNDGTDPDDIADADYTSGFSGTSSACPLAAGIGGLLLSQQPDLTAEEVRQILHDTADKIGPLPYVDGRNNQYGWGRVNAYNALHSDFECFSNYDCDDGLFCNGQEACVANACTPSPGSPCTGACLTGFCNELLDQCYIATGCWINETCFDAWSHNPENPCQVCDPASSYEWTNDDTASCDDGVDCTHTDHCSDGYCSGTIYTCDDGKSCTLDQCNGDGSCTYPIIPLTCLIDDVCYDRWEDNPANPCQECRDDWGTYYDTHWGYDNAASCSDDGEFCTTVHSCQGGVCTGTGPDPCDDVCGTCNETTDTCDNVPGPCNDGLFCNGTDSCENATCSQHTGNPCNTSGECEYCDEQENECIISPGKCSIDNACYDDGDPNPANECEYCATAAFNDQWTARNSNYPCDDGWFCNGEDRCGSGADCAIHDGNPCDIQCQQCNEGANSCSDVGGSCDDGVFCNGTDSCSGGTCSVHQGDPCDPQCESCQEGNAFCLELTGPCDDGQWCNGTDTCSGGTCSVHAGTPCPDDGLWCNGDESCNENGDICISSGTPCTDGSWCNGVEGCDEATDTCDGTHSGNPCAPDCGNCTDTDWDFGLCDGIGNSCDDGLFCNGADTCDQTGCIAHAGDPCGPDQTCNEDLDICEDEGAVCGNGTIEEGEDCEQDADCTGELVCVDCLCEEETAIELLSFEAEADDGAVVLTWETATEPDNAGFALWRSTNAQSRYARITGALIPAQGDPFTGASYEWLDDTVEDGTYFYKLEDIDIHGRSTFHGPVSATVQEEPIFGCEFAPADGNVFGLILLIVGASIVRVRKRVRRT